MQRGQVTDWDMMSEVWNHIFFEKLKDDVKPDEEAVLITESILNNRVNREKAAEILFETFNIPALQFATPAVLGMYAQGKTTGLMVDCGEGHTQIAVVYDGFLVDIASMRVPLGG